MIDAEYHKLRAAAERGDAAAQFSLGWHFDKEQHDYATARQYYERAAAQRYPAAWHNLACMTLHGEGRPRDPTLAAQYYRRAAECGDKDGLYNCATTLEELAATAEEWREVIRLYRRCGPDGWFALGLLYDHGNNFISIDHVQANRYYRRAADAGHLKATTNFALNLSDGIGIRKNSRQAFLYFNFAAKHEDRLAYGPLGEAYLLGLGTRCNDTRAFDWFKRAWFATGQANVAGWLGECYLRGRGIERNIPKARRWLRRAARLGDHSALWTLGYRYVSGDGWPRDTELGRSYLERYLELHPEDADAIYWRSKSFGRTSDRGKSGFELLYRRDRDPWSAYELVQLQLAEGRSLTPEEFTKQEQLLLLAARHQVPSARRLLRSDRWLRLRKRHTR